MAYSTANWHWKNKTVTPWAKEWFERELVAIKVEGSDGAVVSVDRVVSVDGDVELGRRKSKYVRTTSTTLPSDTLYFHHRRIMREREPTRSSCREDAFLLSLKRTALKLMGLTYTRPAG